MYQNLAQRIKAHRSLPWVKTLAAQLPTLPPTGCLHHSKALPALPHHQHNLGSHSEPFSQSGVSSSPCTGA